MACFAPPFFTVSKALPYNKVCLGFTSSHSAKFHPLSIKSEFLEVRLSVLMREIFPDTATGEALRSHWRSRVPPLEPTFAQGDVTFSGTDGTAIPAGSLWKHRSGNLYTLLEGGTILKGKYSGKVIAQELGSKGNLAAGEKLELASSRITGLDSTAAVGVIGGGVDTEDDNTYKARIIAYERQARGAGPMGCRERRLALGGSSRRLIIKRR